MIAGLSGWSADTLGETRSGARRIIPAAFAADVADLYDQLDGELGDSVKSRWRAEHLGWRHRDDWTHRSIDALPATRRRPPAPLWDADPSLVMAVVHGTRPLLDLPRPHRWVPVRALASTGMTSAQIAEHVYATRDQIADALDDAPNRPPGCPATTTGRNA